MIAFFTVAICLLGMWYMFTEGTVLAWIAFITFIIVISAVKIRMEK